MSLPRYSQYKHSNVAWLGEVPTHWEVLQTKRHFQRRKEVNAGMACENRLALTMSGVIPRSLDDLDGLQSNDYEGYQIFEAGDLAFKLIDLQNIKTSRVGLVPERGIMSPAYIRLQPININVRFAYWYFMALYWTQVFNGLGGGVRQTLGQEELLTVELPVPSFQEQEQIANFLGHETAKIDALISEQEKLLVLLAEKRQATISHAVTRGLNPDVPMKDSGVEWLGMVPEHWEALQIRRVASSVKTGGTPSIEQPSIEIDGGMPWYTPGDFNQSMVLTQSEKRIGEATISSGEAKIFPADSVLIVSIGATLGKVGYLPLAASGNQQINAVIPSVQVDGYFLAYSLSSKVSQMRFLSNASTIGIMNQEKTKEIWVAIPPEGEQAEISEYIDRKIKKLSGLEAEVERAIALLRERRSALISAAVTGKIDVRSAVPEEVAA